ncbi:MAG TPA: cytochrome C [Xanthobacteraceae bacterium]|nr:cytochrome C [Xanthobacteraceae bacterium]
MFITFAYTRPAEALPSFARQTGQPCGTCHTDFPGLTPYGRRFKLLGYTVGGGKYRTTPFPALSSAGTSAYADPDLARLAGYLKAPADGGDVQEKGWVPPISAMAIAGFTHTEAPLSPPTAPYSANDNTILSPVSFFWGGAVTESIGAFAQVTWNAPPAGGFPDPFGHTWTWDNTDVRFADTARIGNLDVVYGITANNNPSVQDLWNTTPAWTFPYAASTLAPTPATKTLIDGTFAAHVGSVGAYAMINDLLYLETTFYRTLDFYTQNALGTDPFGAPGLFDGVAPYWRIAIEPHWGNNWFMLGTYGMYAAVQPWVDPTFAIGSTAVFPNSDKFTDIGFDSQYQYQGENFWLTLRGTYIREFQKLDQSFADGSASNPTDLLNTVRLLASFAYGGDHRIVLTGQYFNTWGTPDPLLYGGLASGFIPDSDGWIAEIAYIPFGMSKAPGWPWGNMRLGVQYVAYNKFDGTTVGASNNNTLFVYAWFAW